jgi:pimeloyl-ACP methyl ester carboxylesterase
MHTSRFPSGWIRPVIVLTIAAITLLTPMRAQADVPIAPFPGCATGTLPSGALSLVCIPIADVTGPATGWNHGVVVYAHGYVNFNEPLQLLPDGTTVPAAILSQGFAFATTSYRENGLVIIEGADDIRELMAALTASFGPLPTYIVGASEGGLITTLLVEDSELFLGGLAACAPIGSFRGQIDYIGDFRVLFDYYFPQLIPGVAIRIPTSVIETWFTHYYQEILNALAENPMRTDELLRVAHVAHPFDPGDPTTFAVQAVFALDVLRYSIFGTNDAFSKLGGSPFDNRDRLYIGSHDDADLNRHVQRFNAQNAALTSLQSYETSGILNKPLVTLHTLGDQVIPFPLHEPAYLGKVVSHGGGAFLVQDSVAAYGHCNFQPSEIAAAFQTLRVMGGF